MFAPDVLPVNGGKPLDAEGAVAAAIPATRFHRDLVALRDAALAFRERVYAFWRDHDNCTVGNELVRAGAITRSQYTDDPAVLTEIDDHITAIDDARGFLWSIDMFLGVIGAPDRETEEDATPAVVGGKAVM